MGLADRAGNTQRAGSRPSGGSDTGPGALNRSQPARSPAGSLSRHQFDFRGLAPQAALTLAVVALSAPFLYYVAPLSTVLLPVAVWLGLSDWQRWPRSLVRQIDGEWLLQDQTATLHCLTAIKGHHLPGGLLLLQCEINQRRHSHLVARWQLPLNQYVLLCGLVRMGE